MKIHELETLYARLPQVGALAKELEKSSTTTIFLSGLLASSAPMLFGSLASKCKKRMLFVMQDAEEAGYFYHDLTQLMGTDNVLFFPSSYRRAIKYAQRDAASEILRTEVLARLNSPLPTRNSQLSTLNSQLSTLNSQLYIVTCPEAVAELVVSKKTLDTRMLTLEKNQTIAVSDIERTLREFGFREVDYVYEPGQFALRGSILDVYSFSCEYPYRIDFFGDDIDSIRTFEVENQLSKEIQQRVEIVPELTMGAGEMVPFLSFVPDDVLLVTKDFLYVRDAIDRTYQEGFSSQALVEQMEGATEMERHELEQRLRRESTLITGTQFMSYAVKFRRIEFGHRPSTLNSKFVTLNFNISIQPQFHKNFDLLKESFESFLQKGYQIYICADSQKQNERLKEILNSQLSTLNSQLSTLRSALPLCSAKNSQLPFTPVEKTLHEGFVDDDLMICVFTDHQIFDRFHKYNLRSDKARSGKVALTLKEIQQFEPGDYVVHIDHGIGRFAGLVRMPQGDSYQEMIKIQYEGGGSIYVSIHSLYKVSKYKAQDSGEAPRLSHLGTGQWERMKERTKTKLKDIARDLIKLSAARRRQKGYAFSPDSFMQHELEASFLYEDTPDQLKATNDVKADMEQARPMDRLVCGDVGFGKTEVAVRAAFKAACDSKQVAVLVPTTVLAYQHYQTFSSRLKDLPVRVEYLSRARSAKQTTAILKDLADGKIDIIIGMHKLIGKTVKFHDLGLLIIDE